MTGRGGALALAAALAAFTIWGLSPILYKQLTHVPPVELLCHRILWSFVAVGAFVAATGRSRRVAASFGDWREMRLLAVTTCFISFNWLIFIYAVQIGKALDVSVGFYLFPLISVAIGFVFFRERFSPAQTVAIGFAAVAAAVLGVGLGAGPWIALALSCSFGIYSAIRKTMRTGPITGVMVEVSLVAPIALVWLILVHSTPGGGHFGGDPATTLLLALSGPVTAAPLILFATAAQSLRFSSVGLLQYLNPTLQMIVAVWVFGEVMTVWHAVGLGLIWVGLAIYSRDAWVQERAASRAARAASAESQTVR